jgi:hypothetical protein
MCGGNPVRVAVRVRWILTAVLAVGWVAGMAEGAEARERGGKEWRLRLSATTANAEPKAAEPAEFAALLTTPRAAAVMSSRRSTEPLALDRDPRLSETQLVVASFDRTGRELAWRAVPDPRMVRAEVGRDGALVGARVYVEGETELVVALPDDVGVHELRIFRPRWNGAAFERIEIARLEVAP